MSRSIPEWVGRTDDDPIPTRVKLRVWGRAWGRCEKCEHRITIGERWDIDHHKPLIFGGKHRESNLRLLCLLCHRKKTSGEQTTKAKSDRIRAKHLGIKRPRKIRAWRKFDGTAVFAPRQR